MAMTKIDGLHSFRSFAECLKALGDYQSKLEFACPEVADPKAEALLTAVQEAQKKLKYYLYDTFTMNADKMFSPDDVIAAAAGIRQAWFALPQDEKAELTYLYGVSVFGESLKALFATPDALQAARREVHVTAADFLGDLK